MRQYSFRIASRPRLINSYRYNELLFMIDTCQANTMYSKIYSPNILATGSSELGENSLSVSLREGRTDDEMEDELMLVK